MARMVSLMTTRHLHRDGMTYYTNPKYHGGEILPMHIYAAWSDVTKHGRGILVAGYDPECPAAMRSIEPGTDFALPKIVQQLAEAGSALATARYAIDAAMSTAKEAALAAIADGVTEVDIARSLGVDRMTVRKWAGKR